MNNTQILIRSENQKDYKSVFSIHQEAFKQNNESKLIEALRKTPQFIPQLSLIASVNSQIVGHILFYPLEIKTERGSLPTLGLVPLAVKPTFQQQGIGTQLVNEGLKQARLLGYTSIIVAGNPNYYKKFGFQIVNGLTNNIGEPVDHFMYLELKSDALKEIRGIVEYPSVFKELL